MGLWSPEDVFFSLHQRQGALACGEGSPPLPASSFRLHGGRVCRQFNGRGLPSQTRGHSVACSQHHCAAETLHVVLAPQFIMGRKNVLADSLSKPKQIQGLECTLKMEVFQDLCRKWQVMTDFFANSSNHRFSLYFLPFHDPSALGTDALLQNRDGLQVYAFPPWSLIPLVLKKLRASSDVLMTLVAPYWPHHLWFPDLLELVVDSLVELPVCPDLLRQPHFHSHHLGIR